jgi:hypothetical protein
VKLLNQKQLKRAVDGQTTVQVDLKALLELLMSEDRSDRLKSEQQRIKEYIKEVERLIRLEKSLQGQTEGGADAKKLASEQGRIAGQRATWPGRFARTKGRGRREADEICEQTGRKPEGEKSEGKSGDEQPGKKSGQKGEGKRSRQKGDGQKSGEEEKAGEQKAGKEGRRPKKDREIGRSEVRQQVERQGYQRRASRSERSKVNVVRIRRAKKDKRDRKAKRDSRKGQQGQQVSGRTKTRRATAAAESESARQR